MAEVLGVVAGGAGLVSLAIQIGENAAKIKRLHRTYQGAPAFLEEIAFELDTISHTLGWLERDHQSHGSVDFEIVQRCVRTCEQAANRIGSTVCKLEATMQKSRFRGRLQTLFDHSEMIRLRNDLNEAKLSLLLAYDIYNKSCRTREATMQSQMLQANNDAILQQALLLNNHGNSLQQLQRDLSALSQHVGLATNLRDECARPMDDNANDRNSTEIRRRSTTWASRNHKAHRRWRIITPRWFASQIWEMSLSSDPNGWSLKLRTANLVPSDALIFEACYNGDIRGVQRLFSEGKASPFDYRSERDYWSTGFTILSAAAASGSVQLCRYLIETAGASPIPDDATASLSQYLAWEFLDLPKSSPLAARDMYDLMLEHPGIDPENFFHDRSCQSVWYMSPDLSIMKLVKSKFRPAFDMLPWQYKVEMAIEASTWRPVRGMSAMFLEMLDCPSVNSRVAEATDKYGRTALHMVASNWGRCLLDEDTGPVAVFVQELIRYGADVHHQCADTRDTPLSAILDIQHFGLDKTEALQRWVRLLQSAGVDIEQYGQVETDILQESLSQDTSRQHHHSRRFTCGPNVNEWTVTTKNEHAIHVYKPTSSPGSWPALDERNVWTIPWRPHEEDACEIPFQWQASWQVNLHSLPDSYSAKSVGAHERDITTAYALSQDDWSAVVQLVDRSSRTPSRPRSCSQPAIERRPNEGGIHFYDVYSRGPWLGECHVCLFDNRARLGDIHHTVFYQTSDRRCAKGIHPADAKYLWDGPVGINEQMRRFRRRYRTHAELRDLPYAAYHPRWWKSQAGSAPT